MDYNSVIKRVFERIPEGRPGRDRPSLIWKDSVIENYNKLGTNIAWRTDVPLH